MALRNCRECAEQVSTTALTCPHCGAMQGVLAGGLIGYALAPVFMLLLLYFFWQEILGFYFWLLSNFLGKILGGIAGG